MAKQVRSIEFLPEIFQTPINDQFLSATLDQLIQNPEFSQTQGFIGRRVGPGVNANDRYVIEPTKTRNDYQLEPGVVQLDPANSHRVIDAITYPGINDALKLQGAYTTNADRLYNSDYYTWDPFIDFDKFVNYAQYYWLPGGPLAVDVSAEGVPLTDSFTVTRANGVYTFSGVTGDNPTITLARGGRYTFNVAQNQTETVNFRVTNNNTSSWNIDFQPNPTLTLARGNTYVFNLSQTFPWAFYFKTKLSLGTTNIYSNGVFNGGASDGLITFTVPQDAPDTLYYCNDLQINLRGQINIVNPGGVEPYDTTKFDLGLITNDAGTFDYAAAVPLVTGPGFWIQTDPGVNGRIPVTPNISSRLTEANGVINNGEDLGTVTFNVPLATAQDRYFNMPSIGRVDLVTALQFDQINNQLIDVFLENNPNGIDGITNLENRTIAFLTRDSDPDTGGWQQESFFDPLVRTTPNQVSAMVSYDVNGQPYDDLPYNTITAQIISGSPDPQDGNPGSFDSLPYSQTTLITDPATQYSVWRIKYLTADTGSIYMSLQFVQNVDLNNKFTVGFGTEYASTSWYKDDDGFFSEIPLLTADKSLLFYQDSTDPEIFGRIRIINQQVSTRINVDEIIGSPTYTSPNGVIFTNGMKVVFRGDVYPISYQDNEYYVEGVGTAIRILPVEDFVTPETYTVGASVPFDSVPYDFGNFDGSLNQPAIPDYLTVNRASLDLNAWTRSNRWFHIDVINASAAYNNTTPVLDNNFRARRPILEFRAGTRLFGFGTEELQSVDIVDFTQTDALSNVNGSVGYGTDGYTLINGSTVIFAADLDLEVRKTVYQVQFVTPDTVPPLIPEPIIVLTPIATALADQTVVVLSGITEQGISCYYNGVDWSPPPIMWVTTSGTAQPAGSTPVTSSYATRVTQEGLLPAQQKISVNQPPLFNIYDSKGISFGDRVIYPSSNFRGSPLFSYAIGNAFPDLVLGFPLTYLSLTNLGDIVFDNNFYKDSFSYTIESAGQTVPLSTGFVRQYETRLVFEREIGWQTAVTTSLVRQQFQFTYDGSPLLLDVAVNNNNTVPAVQIFANGQFQEAYNYQYTIGTNTTTINLLTTYVPGDLIEVVVLSDQVSATGFYQVPVNLSNNPLNGNSDQFTLGTIRNHYTSIAENLIALSGPVIGANNTRDLGNIIPYGLQILQQSSPATLAGYFMRDANYDIFASLAYNSTEYIKFKSQLLNAVTTFGIADYDNWTVAELLDASIAQITAGRTNLNSFYWSDMLPTGTAFISNSYTVNPITINRFNTQQTYNFTESNYLGLCVYVNNVLLTRDYQYVVSTEGPTLTITTPLAVGDVVTINEYSDTAGNFVPNTPTKLGLYPKYEPKIFLDVDYVNPTPVIQGHDGSITVAFGDIRDQVLLEFEQRIFSNLKNDGNPPPLVAEDVIPGQFRTTDYTQDEVNQILGENFLAWAGANKLDYTSQTYIAGNEFTYNYSQASNRLDTNTPLLGAWRGIYRWFYDTLTPNLTPWEMLGFSEMPAWWTDRYGPVPYTSDNLVLWGDLEAGLVADPVAPYIIPKYRRPGLTSVIPVDSQGQLIPPFYSVMGAYNPQGFVKSWQVGDGGPVEASWWSSSSYPFAVMRLLVLTRPAEFFSLFADRDLYRYNTEFDQYLYNGRYRIQPQNIQVYGNGTSKASYINWIVDYNQQLAMNSTDALTTDLSNLDVRLCYRAASFMAQENLKLYLEKSAPQSQNDSLLIPPESYNLLLYKNQPFNRIDYSAVIVEVVEGGYSVYGYSTTNPYFNISVSKVAGLTQTITAGNISVTVPSQYSGQVAQIPYGYIFTTLASVVDFLLSYGDYLKTQGLTFTARENGYTLNWIQMSQEFVYFANQGWAEGTIINLNPSANQAIALRPGSVVDSIVTYTPENLIKDQNRQALNARNLVVFRQGNIFRVNPAPGGSQTISYLQLKFTDYEDMIVLDNRTIFNDLVYNTITAERQNRLRLSAATSTQWNGTLNAQGFILNQDNVVAWKSNTKYTKGDIVIYKNSYWQAANIVQPKEKFDYTDWYKSNYDRIEQGLLQNLATKADQLVTSYDTQTANLNRDNDLLAYGLIGFRPRQYMVDLNLTDASQVQLYQQFIKTMGSKNATDLFSPVDFNNFTSQYNIYETWGIQIGTYGAQANRSWFEVALDEAVLNGNPSTFQIIQPGQTSEADQTILLSNLWAESYAIPNTDILPTTYTRNLDTALPTAGYVNINDVDITVFSLNNPSAIAAQLTTVGNGTTIWVARDNSYDWNIYQCVQVPGRLTQVSDNLNGTSVAQFSGTVDLAVGDLIIIRYFNTGVDGVYRILSRPAIDSAVIRFAFVNSNQTTITGTGIVFRLQTMRVSQASDVVNLPYANQLIPGAQAWVDNNGSGHWEVIQKTSPFAAIQAITANNPEVDSLFGSSLAQTSDHYAMIVGSPGSSGSAGAVYTYRSYQNQYIENTKLLLSATDVAGYGNSVDFGNRTWAVAGASASNSGAGYATVLYLIPATSDYVQTQLLVAPDQDFSASRFGSAVQISDDERWMYVSAPGANKIYAYGRVDVPYQSVSYVANGTASLFNYSNSITINYAYPEQLLVTVNNVLQTYGVNYTLTDTSVNFTLTPAANNKIFISRRRAIEITNFNASTLSLVDYLYTATNYDSFTVSTNGVLQRPYIDYTFSGGVVTFITIPTAGSTIEVLSAVAGAYWQYVNVITALGIDGDAGLGTSLTTDQLGLQLLAGAPLDSAPDADGNIINNPGTVYAFDRSTIRYIITDASQLTYAIPGTYTNPVAVVLNNQYLTNTAQYVNGQFTVSGSNIVLSSSVSLTVGDTLEIETNQFQFVQKFASNVVIDEAEFGQSIDICPNNCSVYVGAPQDSDAAGVFKSGLVQRQVNQSRIYGVTTSTVANPSLTTGDTLRINLQQVAITADNNVAGLVNAINASAIPNVVASLTPDVTFVADGSTQTFDIGNIYSSASAYTTVVYVNAALQTENVDYTYNNSTKQIIFVTAPTLRASIRVVSGRVTVSVINSAAAVEFNKLTVLPGVTGTAFADLGFTTYLYTQTIVSPNPTAYAQFGASVNVNTGAVNLVVGSPNGDVYEPTTFDAGKTYFDERSTTFFGYINNSGVVYTYDYLPSASISAANPGNFVFGQQVYVNTLQTGDQFGSAVNYRSGRLVVGAPGDDLPDGNQNYGSISVLDNPADSAVWQVLYTQQPMVDVNLINSVYSYNKLLNSVQTYFDYIDPLQGKILGVARRNIDYIGAVDPASYNAGTVHNIGTSWGAAHEGEIWWDTNSVRFIDANQDNLTYASRRWGQVFPGSTIDIYQWTASSVLPADYTGPGVPFSAISYTTHSTVNNQGLITTTYYFWVRGITTTATQFGKTLSATAIASYILDPSSSGLPYIAALTANAVAIYNSANLLSANNTILHIEYDRQAAGGTSDIHTEYEFIADGKAESFLNANLYRKLLDSFCGTTTTGAAVPDPLLSPGMQYGVEFRPRQSMFLDRFKALENYLTRVNNILAQYPIVETRNFYLLNSAEPTPASFVQINAGSFSVGTQYTIYTVGTTDFTLIGADNNAVGTTFIATGVGEGTGAATYYNWNYEVPNLEILAYQDLALVPIGYRYLVQTDSSQHGRWTIYRVIMSSETGRPAVELAQVQSYDTPLYWNHVDWYLPGYNSSVQPAATVANTAELQTLTLDTAPLGSSVKVTNINGTGKFEIYLRTGINPITGWQRVGLQDGTIAFSEVLWNYPLGGFGFDAEVFDALYFDQEPVVETRYILRAINEELFIDDLLIYRNQSLMLMFQFIYSELTSPSWLIKTSYIDVDHVVGGLYPYELYQPDNQTFVLDYLNEVKPYHVQTLAFNLIYEGLDLYSGALTDYDVPAYWDLALESPQFVSPILTPYTYSNSPAQSFASDAASNAQIWLERPWSNWFNNYTLSVDSVNVIDTTTTYNDVPIITIGYKWTSETTYSAGEQIFYGNNLYTVTTAGTTGTATPTFSSGSSVDGTATLTYTGVAAKATAILRSNSTIYSVTVTNPGSGYLITPVIAINGVYPTFAPIGPEDPMGPGPVDPDYLLGVVKLVPVMGNSLVRDIKTTIRYDRFQYASTIVEWQADVVYTEGELVRWSNRVWSANATQSSATFVVADWTQVDVAIYQYPGSNYQTGLTGADRTMGYYTPTVDMPGLSLPLLIDGVTYPGVQVSAPGFNQNTGFDVGNFDINPFDNIAYNENGQPTYDPAILDARYSSAYLDVYLGVRPADINVDGGGYIDTFSSYAPEELVPGSMFDTLDFRVYTRPVAIYVGDGSTRTFAAPAGSTAVVVTANNLVLTPSADYTYASGIVTLTRPADTGSQIVVLESDPESAGLALRIFQDMRGYQATYRITPATTTTLTQDLLITDDIIYVLNADALAQPDVSANIWGVLTVNAERIMYRALDRVTNTVSGLLRGTAGTAVADHSTGVTVYNMSRDNFLPVPYQNYVVSDSQLGNGTNTVFVANNVSLVYGENYDTLPYDVGNITGEPGSYDYGQPVAPDTAVEVYVGGIRIQTDYTITQNQPVTVVFDTAPPDGVDVTILVRRGVTWYQPGVDPETPSNGEPLQVTETVPARFFRG
jgi:hypothetical protein